MKGIQEVIQVVVRVVVAWRKLGKMGFELKGKRVVERVVFGLWFVVPVFFLIKRSFKNASKDLA